MPIPYLKTFPLAAMLFAALMALPCLAQEPQQPNARQITQNAAEPSPSTQLSPNEHADIYEISTLQKRRFSKAQKFEISPTLGVIPSDIFVVYLPLTLRMAYHFNEALSLELQSSFLGCFSSKVGPNQTRAASQNCLRFMSPAYQRLSSSNKNITQIRNIAIQEWQTARFALNPVWAPFFGKFSLANNSIVHFDLHITAGIGLLLTETIDENTQNIQIHPNFEGNLGAGLKFFFLQFLGLRFDFRTYLFPKQKNKGLGTATEFSVGLSFLI